LYFKSCPRCQTGAIEHNSDSWGQYLLCLMCGYQRDFEAGIEPAAEIAKARLELERRVAGVAAKETAAA
jgi:hypothetical protein